ncbi:hypothetical protein [Sphaerisporangium sp. TRM90804]|uniref:ACP S-malonyltransferase n=1 Tax=Sphaerisporangium sp. TRM90804 TaxID=3031113 RepID=UPI00244CAF22|nr:hypothetical protein [Sphaerisporangium sp. TRM90804]MDH2430867.1 hypothetical protein [Sphaerisporangium sp. TRM90804]
MDTQPGQGTAMVFPGMGPGTFTDVARFMSVNPFARKLLATADDVLGYRLVDRYRESDGHYAKDAQIAFMVNCLALARWAHDRLEVAPDYVVGPSFGWRAVTAYTRALDLPDAISMAARLADCMEEYFRDEHPGLVTHSIARVPQDRLAELLREFDERGEWHDVSCRVDHDFTMITFGERQLDWVLRRVRALGGLSLYTMKPPMHSRAFTSLRHRITREVFAGLTWSDPAVPVVADQDGRVLTTGEQVRDLLLDGCDHAVCWPDVVSALSAAGVGTLYVAGQDGLFTRVACTTRAFEVVPITPRSVMRPVRGRPPRRLLAARS